LISLTPDAHDQAGIVSRIALPVASEGGRAVGEAGCGKVHGKTPKNMEFRRSPVTFL
jgi:hypothetical protein